MGASSSKTTPTGGPETPVQMSPDLINHIAHGDSRGPTMDARIQAHIKAEVERLQQQEAELQAQIQKELAKENLETETNAQPGGRDALVLQSDLEALGKRIKDAMAKESKVLEMVREPRSRVIECYKKNPTTTLDCWKETEDFREAVRKIEAEFISTSR